MSDDLPDQAKTFMHPVMGTPKTLDEALVVAICIGALSEVQERSYHVFKDYMAQKFGVAYLKADGDEKLLKVLQELFEELTKRSPKP